MPISHPLGRLEPVQLREAWLSEAGDFTPWLAEEENIQLLGDTIGIDLEVEGQEQSVGPFRADILCKDADENWVLIENQLEQTDHKHLGQLITYAAGLNTVTIIWVAQKFREEHRAALDWLNSVTSEDIRFFGLQVELWRIGNSAIAPKFNIISSPNDWSKGLSEAREHISDRAATPVKERQLRFWTGFSEYLEREGCEFRHGRPSGKPVMRIKLGRSGISLVAIASHWNSETRDDENHELRAEVRMSKGNSQAFYDQLRAQRDEIESELGEPLLWRNQADVRRKRILLHNSVDLEDENRWPEYYDWLRQKLNALYRVFSPRVRQLSSDVTGTTDDEQEDDGDV